MLINSKHLRGLSIHATDGELGTVDELYYEDETWVIRYLTVDTGNWLSGRHVLISPISVLQIDWDAKSLSVNLTKKQVENSPDIDTHQPVSRQHEADYYGYYGYPFYWGGPYLWGTGFYPEDLAASIAAPSKSLEKIQIESADAHLRTADALIGSHVEASDGVAGHVDGLILDDKTWTIRYLEVATRDWWPGKKILLSPAWVERIKPEDSKLYVSLNREAMKNSPAYEEFSPITREYENQLHLHYNRPPYWQHETQHKSSFSLSDV